MKTTPIKKSLSGWEDSLYGGASTIIWDYPTIHIDRDVNIDIDRNEAKESDLRYYECNKLFDMFLLKVHTNKKVDRMFEDAHYNIVPGSMWNPVPKVEITVNKNSLIKVFDKVCDVETELGGLFQMFEKLILASTISVLVPLSDKDKSKGKGPGDSIENADKPEYLNKALSKMKETKEFKKYLYSSSKKFEFSGGDFDKTVKTFIQKDQGVHYTYSSKEKLYAGQLVNLLDITWDPESDIVKSLRAGKLDVTKIAEVPSGNLNIYNKKVEHQTTKPFSICILADESGSMGGSRIINQISLVKMLYLAFSEILPQDKIYIFGHSGNSHCEVFVYQDKYNQFFEKSIVNMGEGLDDYYNPDVIRERGHHMYENYDGPAIEEVHKRVRSQTSDRIIFLSLSDGYPGGVNYGSHQDYEDLKRVVEKCRRDEFVTAGIGIQSDSVKNLYPYNIVVKDLAEMPKLTSHIINTVVKSEFQ